MDQIKSGQVALRQLQLVAVFAAACSLLACGVANTTITANQRSGDKAVLNSSPSANGTASSAPASAARTFMPINALGLTYTQDIAPIMTKYCTSCHSTQVNTANINLDSYADTGGVGTLVKWQAAAAAMTDGSMPPSGAKPSAVNLAMVSAWAQGGAPETSSKPSNGYTYGACDPANRSPAVLPLTRMSHDEYMNTLTDLLGAAPVAALSGPLAEIPTESGSLFDTMNLEVTSDHVSAYFDVADNIGDVMTTNATFLAQIAPCMTTAANNQDGVTCLGTFLTSFGQQVFRRPLSPTETASYNTIFQAGQAVSNAFGLDLVLSAMFQSPQFLYLASTDGPTVLGGNVEVLTQYELATRLSYLLWRSTPDAALLAAAGNATLSTPTVFKAQVERLLADPKAHQTLNSFFTQWLGYTYQPPIPTVVGQTNAYNATQRTGILSGMLTELNSLTTYLTFTGKGTYRDLLTTNQSFMTSPDLAAIYGSAVPTDPTQPVTLSDPNRAGILSRSGMLYSSSNGNGSEILRGAHLRERMLCEQFVQPAFSPAQQAQIASTTNATNQSTRDKMSALTLTGSCAGCHQYIDQMAFATGNYDIIGNYRTIERDFDIYGNLLGQFNITSVVDPAIDTLGEAQVTGIVGFEQAMLKSTKAPQCFVTQVYRFSAANNPDSSNSCLTQDMSTVMKNNGSMLDVFRAYLYSPEFKLQRFAL